jgi:hypothetical protein
MNENPKTVVWAVILTKTQKHVFGGVQIFATEAAAQRAVKDFNDSHPAAHYRIRVTVD